MVGLTAKLTFNRFPTVRRAFPGAIDKRLRTAAESVKEGAARRSRVDTGRMRAGWEVEGGRGEYRVKNDVPYTVYNEYGTVHMTAAPMLHPAIDEESGKLANRFLGFEADLS